MEECPPLAFPFISRYRHSDSHVIIAKFTVGYQSIVTEIEAQCGVMVGAFLEVHTSQISTLPYSF
jgi:hypothetical protein